MLHWLNALLCRSQTTVHATNLACRGAIGWRMACAYVHNECEPCTLTATRLCNCPNVTGSDAMALPLLAERACLLVTYGVALWWWLWAPIV
jgi:hypothetical protein